MTSMLFSVLKKTETVRVAIGMAFLVLVSLFSTVKLANPADRFLYRFAGVTEVVPDEVTLLEQRFSILRAVLPKEGIVGYATDQDMQTYAAYEQYLVTRYTLAPVLVENNPHRALVVGNITKPTTDLRRFLDDNHLRLLQDLGSGVVLLESRQR